jgi:phospholipid/cholesterol/gamma-HCH transport system substrate-binding protein
VSPRSGQAALTASPVLVGAVTVLVTIVAVFLSYNANSGLPFVPTYDLKANLPNAAQLVKGFEVRIGGARVGFLSKIEPRKRADGSAYAQITMKLDKEIEPIPADSTLLVRPRSSLGLKYVELTPGEGKAGLAAGSTIPLRQARPAVVELDDLFGMFDAKSRVGQRKALDGFGGGFAGRGQDLNAGIEAFVPLLTDLEPVARNLSDPDTRLNRFFASLARASAEVAPVAEEQASLFVNLDTAFTAWASVARPFLQETISESPPSEQVAIEEFPHQRPFIRNNTAFFRELRPGVAVLPHAAPILADAFEAGTEVLPRTKQMNEDLADVFEKLDEFGDDPLVRAGVNQLTRLASSLRPTLRFLTPTQTTCNYASIFLRNIASLLSEGDANGNYQRFLTVSAPTDPLTFELGPNNEGGPSDAPANGPGVHNHLHTNPYPNAAAPGQTNECEAGNEKYALGQTVIGNTPGDQGLKTDGQR